MTAIRYGQGGRFATPQPRTCSRCDVVFLADFGRQHYCMPCRTAKLAENQAKSVISRRRGKTGAVAEIKAGSDGSKQSIVGVFERPQYEWFVTYHVDYSGHVSKNSRFNFSKLMSGPMVTRAAKSYQAYVALATKRALADAKIVQNKIWISLFVQKPDHRSDAINVIDTICDGIRDGLPIDDKWFCIDQVNWSVVKNNNGIIIRIGQTTRDPVIVCTHCGEDKPFDQFGVKKGNPFDKSRVCKPCKSLIDGATRKARLSVTACDRPNPNQKEEMTR